MGEWEWHAFFQAVFSLSRDCHQQYFNTRKLHQNFPYKNFYVQKLPLKIHLLYFVHKYYKNFYKYFAQYTTMVLRTNPQSTA